MTVDQSHGPRLLGAHMSIAGGLDRAVARIRSIGGTALQLFTRNQRQWRISPLSNEAVADFRAAVQAWGNYPVAAHDAYLNNLASQDAELAGKSIDAVAEELRRVDRLGIPWLVTHAGAHGGAGVEAGLRRFAANLDRALDDSGTTEPIILLENAAGQGTSLGSRFEELAEVLSRSMHPGRLGLCLDTCHAFAAGYDLSRRRGWSEALVELDRLVGLKRVKLVHANDCKAELGSRKDRHAHVGRGNIGPLGFRLLMTEPRLAHAPCVLETPKGEDLYEARLILRRLEFLARRFPRELRRRRARQ